MSEMGVSRKEAARHLLRVRDAQESFRGFVELHHPDFTLQKFQIDLIEALDAVERGETSRLLITMPPRHGKSWLASWQFPAYFIARDPRRQVIATSYNSELAQDFGRRVRAYATDPLTAQAFPNFSLSKDAKAMDRWTVEGSTGAYMATGIGGTVTGRGANLLVIDDPIKDRVEAESATYRNRVWAQYTSALSTRLLEDGRIVVILTRWHPDDLAGRLMKSSLWKDEGWTHINFPAIQTIDTEVTMSRHDLPQEDPRWVSSEELKRITPSKRFVKLAKEAALWPDHYPLDRLKRQRALDQREFASLYMQQPYIEGGNLLKMEWWQYYKKDPDSPIGLPQDVSVQSIIISWDTAFKAKEVNDYSVGVVAAIGVDGNIYILDVLRRRMEFPDLKRAAITLNTKYRGRGLMGTYIEDKASGQSLIQELRNESGISVIPWKTKGDKVIRLQAVSPQIEGGRVYLPEEAPWLDDFLEEATAFPNSTHDDQVDSLVIALDAASRVALNARFMYEAPLNLEQSLAAQIKSQQSTTAVFGSPMQQQAFGQQSIGRNWSGWGE